MPGVTHFDLRGIFVPGKKTGTNHFIFPVTRPSLSSTARPDSIETSLFCAANPLSLFFYCLTAQLGKNSLPNNRKLLTMPV
jgi:hypothetical protein